MPVTKKFGASSGDEKNRPSSIALGIGGAGRNIITDIDSRSLSNVKLYEVGESSRKPELPFISISKKEMKNIFHSGLGIAQRPMTSSERKIKNKIKGADLIYLISGLGGEIGSWSVPVCAELAKKFGKFTFGAFAKPFKTESKRRRDLAEKSQKKTIEHLDLAGIFPNGKLLDINPHLPIKKAFKAMNNIIRLPVLDLNGVLTEKDIPELKKFCEKGERFRIGAGYGKGREKGIRAAKEALNSPWLDDYKDYEILIAVVTNGTKGEEIHAKDALEKIRDEYPDSDMIWGMREDPSIGKRTRVTLLAGN